MPSEREWVHRERTEPQTDRDRRMFAQGQAAAAEQIGDAVDVLRDAVLEVQRDAQDVTRRYRGRDEHEPDG